MPNMGQLSLFPPQFSCLCLIMSRSLGAMQISIARISYGNVAGWLTGCLSQPVLYQND